MFAKNVTPEDIRGAAETVGVGLRRGSTFPNREAAAEAGGAWWESSDVRPRGNGFRFQLVTDGERTPSGRLRRGAEVPFRRFSPHLRRDGGHATIPGAVCWHGHRDFLRELFRRCPDATVQTALATYKGAEGFEAEYLETAPPWDSSEGRGGCSCEGGYW